MIDGLQAKGDPTNELGQIIKVLEETRDRTAATGEALEGLLKGLFGGEAPVVVANGREPIPGVIGSCAGLAQDLTGNTQNISTYWCKRLGPGSSVGARAVKELLVSTAIVLALAGNCYAHGIHGPDDDHGFIMPQPTKLEIVYDDRGIFGQTCEVHDRDAPCCSGELNPVGDVKMEGEFCLPDGFPINRDTWIFGGVNAAGGDMGCDYKADGSFECNVASRELKCMSNDMKFSMKPLSSPGCYSYKWRGKRQYVTSPAVFLPPHHEWWSSLMFVTEAPGENSNDTGLFLASYMIFQGTDFKCLNDGDRRECGDANGNGELTIADAVVVLRTTVGAGSCGLRSCDLDGSFAVGLPDALHDLRAVVGLLASMDCPHQLAFVYSGPLAGAIQFDVTYLGDTLGDCSSDFLIATNDDDGGSATIGAIDLDGIASGGTVAVCENLLNPDEVFIEHLETFTSEAVQFVGGSVTAVLR